MAKGEDECNLCSAEFVADPLGRLECPSCDPYEYCDYWNVEFLLNGSSKFGFRVKAPSGKIAEKRAVQKIEGNKEFYYTEYFPNGKYLKHTLKTTPSLKRKGE